MPNNPPHVHDHPQHFEAALDATADLDLPGGGAAGNVVALPLHRQQRRPAPTEATGEDIPEEDGGSETGGRELGPDRLVAISLLCGQLFELPEGEPLSSADQRWFAELTTGWVRAGRPADLRVWFRLSDAAELLGPSGESELPLVRASLVRLRTATFSSLLRHPDGREETALFGLVERAGITQPRAGAGWGWVELNRQVGELLQAGSVTHLHAPTWDRMRRRDELAARLWAFLESQEMPTLGRRYNLFPVPPGEVPRPGTRGAVARLLGLDEPGGTRSAADRISLAARVVTDVDPRYALALVKGARAGMWRLEVRLRRLVPAPDRD